MTPQEINQLIKDTGVDTNLISDGYHTFSELYNHRIELFIRLCHREEDHPYGLRVWKSKKHSDGSEWEGWFLLGMGKETGKQITYHLPMSKWEDCPFDEVEQVPAWDGHNSKDVLERLKLY